MNLANRLQFAKLKSSKLVVTIDNRLANLFICQTFFCQTLEKSRFAKHSAPQTFLLYGNSKVYGKIPRCHEKFQEILRFLARFQDSVKDSKIPGKIPRDSCSHRHDSELCRTPRYHTDFTTTSHSLHLSITHTSLATSHLFHSYITHLMLPSYTLDCNITHTSPQYHTHFTTTSHTSVHHEHFMATSHSLQSNIIHNSQQHHMYFMATSHTLHYNITHTSSQHHTHTRPQYHTHFTSSLHRLHGNITHTLP